MKSTYELRFQMILDHYNMSGDSLALVREMKDLREDVGSQIKRYRLVGRNVVSLVDLFESIGDIV